MYNTFNISDFFGGMSFSAFDHLGCHRKSGNRYVFRVYAPKATRISVTGDFNNWSETPLRRDISTNIFEAEIGGVQPGMMYKYKIYAKPEGSPFEECFEHCDPYGFGMELRPKWASIVRDLDKFKFTDEDWVKSRDTGYNNPINIYEIHAGSWRKKEDGSWYTYSELGDLLIPYLKENGYTHVELMPIAEHPVDVSWGYQTTGFFSPTSRYGTADDLMNMVNNLHNNGIGAILDFVPIHFAVDSYALGRFDGSPLYEYPDDHVGKSEWGSYNFNFGKGEVRSFLQSAANYWITKYHFDGLRIDAVSRAIFWLGDPDRGVNECAVEFIQNMNKGLKARHSGIMLIAEDSTDYLKVTAPVEYDGLGFDYKWDMGWMNDTLDFFRLHPMERTNNVGMLTFSMLYFYNELYMISLSHDEVVHGKATIIQKMWGDYEVKFPQARLLYMYMYTHPGKKLNFMGNEFGQFREWDETREQDWFLKTYPLHDSFARYMRDLNRVYIYNKPLYCGEYNSADFNWYCLGTNDRALFIYERGSDVNGKCLVMLNFSDCPVENYTFELNYAAAPELMLNTDADIYSGSTKSGETGVIFEQKKDGKTAVTVNLPPFGGQIFKI